MTLKHSKEDRKLLEKLCDDHSVDLPLVEDLFKIEKEYQLQDRRHGIFDRLKECIQASISREESQKNERAS